ncbi:hypothetical protein DFJ73DRAFT_921386 [Zopfochytrium polystomum]|nr:hypothetical protein DFJ73DRAFT_921386 [Zopfochytrium polystomum]
MKEISSHSSNPKITTMQVSPFMQLQQRPPTTSPGAQGPMINIVFQVAVPAHQLVRGGPFPAGAFQFVAAPQFHHNAQVFQPLAAPPPPPPPPRPHPVPRASQEPEGSTPPSTSLSHKSHPATDRAPTTNPKPPLKPDPSAGVVATAASSSSSPSPSPSANGNGQDGSAWAAGRRRAAAPCAHNRRRSQCVSCFELGHGGGSICIHRRRKAGCRFCRAEGRDFREEAAAGPRRRIRGPNTYVAPPPPPPPLPEAKGGGGCGGRVGSVRKEDPAAVGSAALKSAAVAVPPAAVRATGPSVFSVEALCGATSSVLPRGLKTPMASPGTAALSGSPTPEFEPAAAD